MKQDIFINHIKVNEVRNIIDLEIPLSQSERKHLILTGKNGSGKTSLLIELNNFLENVFNGQYARWILQTDELTKYKNQLEQLKKSSLPNEAREFIQVNTNIEVISNWLEDFGDLEVNFTRDYEISNEASQGNFLLAFFEANSTADTSLHIPSGIQKVELQEKYSPKQRANSAFLQYIVNLKAERSFARDDEDLATVEQIDTWFSAFENRLKDIFEAPSLQLEFDRKNYNFNLIVDGQKPYTFSELSDGHSAILTILTELILRMEAKSSRNYDMQGIVLIDEIETHLHVDLQKKILPFLSDFFPNLQFIITTHSPFVLSSIENAVICDLQNRIVTEDLSGYSYDVLIESYFSSDKYSNLLQDKLSRYEVLSKSRTENEMDEFLVLKNYFSSLPKYLSDELNVKLQQIELSLLGQNGPESDAIL